MPRVNNRSQFRSRESPRVGSRAVKFVPVSPRNRRVLSVFLFPLIGFSSLLLLIWGKLFSSTQKRIAWKSAITICNQFQSEKVDPIYSHFNIWFYFSHLTYLRNIFTLLIICCNSLTCFIWLEGAAKSCAQKNGVPEEGSSSRKILRNCITTPVKSMLISEIISTVYPLKTIGKTVTLSCLI